MNNVIVELIEQFINREGLIDLAVMINMLFHFLTTKVTKANSCEGGYLIFDLYLSITIGIFSSKSWDKS